jgi:hypothetical protein
MLMTANKKKAPSPEPKVEAAKGGGAAKAGGGWSDALTPYATHPGIFLFPFLFILFSAKNF